MLAKLTLAGFLALPALGVGVAAGEDDVPPANPDIAIIEQIDVTSLPQPEQAGAWIRQHGVGNQSEIHQRDGGGNSALNIQSGDGIRTRIVQNGEGGSARVFAEGLGHSGLIEQSAGLGNIAELSQRGPGPNAAEIRQSGDANQLTAAQTSISPDVAGGSYLGMQRGAGNQASAVQDGVSLFAIQQQYGRSNTATLFQQGADSEAIVVQDGVENHAEQVQFGNGLTSVIMQTNDNNTAVSQQIGDNLDPVIIFQEGGAAVVVTVQAGAN